MSLDFNVTACDKRAREEGPRWRQTEEFIFAALAIGMTRLEPKNHDEWRYRLLLLATTTRSSTFEKLAKLDEHEFKIRDGLSTNVGQLTRARFKRLCFDRVDLDVRYALRKAAEKRAKEEGEAQMEESAYYEELNRGYAKDRR